MEQDWTQLKLTIEAVSKLPRGFTIIGVEDATDMYGRKVYNALVVVWHDMLKHGGRLRKGLFDRSGNYLCDMFLDCEANGY